MSQQHVTGYVRQRRAEGRRDSTINKELRTLRQALAWALKHDWIGKAPHIDIPAPNALRDCWLTREEAARLLDAAAPHIRMFCALALYTGARKSAILELSWGRVDLERGLIIYPLPRCAYRAKRRAIVPVIKPLRVELERALTVATTDWVIEHDGLPVASIKTGFNAACRRAGIESVTPHDLRRTCATWLVQEGVSADVVAEILADTPEMVRKVYGYHDPARWRTELDKLVR